MKIVTFQELCALPDGVIFSSYEPCIASGLFRREEVIACSSKELIEYYKGTYCDFYYNDLLPSPNITCIHESDLEMKFDKIDSTSRWGRFEPNELFVLYTEKDIKLLVEMLTGVKSGN